MRIEDDDFPYTSDDPSLAPVEVIKTTSSLPSQQPDDLKATLRLIVGSAFNGRDAYVQRLRMLQAEQAANKSEFIEFDEVETIRDELRYLLLGILFETPDLLQRSLETAGKASSKVYGLFSKILSPFTDSWIFSPVKDQYNHAVGRGEKVIDRLIRKGRLEERNSRLMLQQKAIDDLINEVLEYVILKTEVQQILQERGVGMAGDAIDEYREQSATVDSILEQKLKSIFQKRTPSPPVTPPSNQEEGG